jgi:2,5-dihydroxypyridine 5,6-dioxygenase
MSAPEWQWIECFAAHFARCGLHRGETVVLLSETQSRSSLVDTARLAAQSLGATLIDVVLPTPVNPQPVPIRSTGASQAIAHHRAALGALTSTDMVIDCTVEGLLHAPELGQILSSGSRVLMISNEHPDNFVRISWDDDLPRRVAIGYELLKSATTMQVSSGSGTDLTIQLAGAFTAGSSGLTEGPGSIAHWPGGLVLAFPATGTVNGTLVLAPGDLNLTFNRFMESAVRLTIVDDFITSIDGDGLDAELFASYLAAFGDRESYATSHVGWGMNPRARWETTALYDRRELWGTEARAFSGNFLYSCGANEGAGRFTAGHFDLPMRRCSVTLRRSDGTHTTVVDHGVLADELASATVSPGTD